MKKEICIIDDDSIYRMIISKTINIIASPLNIYQCENGQLGLEILEKLRHSEHEIIVFLDINMPVLDGWGVLENMEKNNLHNLALLQIYIVSSSTDESDILKAKSYDFVKGFIHKPLNKDVLLKILGSE